MNEQQKSMFERQMKLQRGAAIIEGNIDKFRADGYTNMLNKYGTMQDNSTAYRFSPEMITSDMELVRLYEGNGLFAKIIDRPAEEAVKHGLDIDFGDEDIAEYVEDRLDELEYEAKFAEAEKWARLFGGAIIVMLVDDGRGLEEPLDWRNVRRIEELRVFERSVVQPDYTTMHHYHFNDTINKSRTFGEPNYYMVTSLYGTFIVHRSRCLVFRNGKLPEQTSNANYRYWGIPEYVKIKRALRECVTSHENGTKLLERSVQAIYKIKNLSNMLATADGEDKAIQRLQVIDMARGILNTIAVDADGEDYDFKTLSMAGVKDVIDATCNMLSAVTDIPQTILFGRSPAGMNSTGESDTENYYSMVENIQKQNMKANTRILIDLINRQGVLEGRIKEEPKYKVKFAALWSLTEAEQATVDKIKADTDLVNAQTEQIYMETNVLDPTDVRNSLAKDGRYELDEVISDNDLDIPEDTFDMGETIRIIDTGEDAEDNVISIVEDDEIISIQDEVNKAWKDNDEIITIEDIDLEGTLDDDSNVIRIHDNAVKYPAAAVIILNEGKILCARRSESGMMCGPGGKTEDYDADSVATAVREAQEEFGITPHNLIPLGEYKASSDSYLNSMVYFTDEFTGTPEADGSEMLDAQWLSMEELRKEQLFPPFEASLDMLENFLKDFIEK